MTQGRFIICAAMCQPHCVVDSIVRLATRSGHLATILHPTKPAADRHKLKGIHTTNGGSERTLLGAHSSTMLSGHCCAASCCNPHDEL